MEETVEVNPDIAAPETEKPMDYSEMAEQLKRLRIDVLRAQLEGYGLVAEEDTPKAKIVEAIVEHLKAKLAEADKTTAESAEQMADEDDPLVKMKFQNLESPNAPLEFTFTGPKGFKLTPAGQPIAAPKYHFYDGRTYDVPYSVYKHLNSLRVPADVQVQTNAEGFIQSLYSGDSRRRNRFSCQLVLTAEQQKQIINTQRKE